MREYLQERNQGSIFASVNEVILIASILRESVYSCI